MLTKNQIETLAQHVYNRALAANMFMVYDEIGDKKHADECNAWSLLYEREESFAFSLLGYDVKDFIKSDRAKEERQKALVEAMRQAADVVAGLSRTTTD